MLLFTKEEGSHRGEWPLDGHMISHCHENKEFEFKRKKRSWPVLYSKVGSGQILSPLVAKLVNYGDFFWF